jgi:hypothetical protein
MNQSTWKETCVSRGGRMVEYGPGRGRVLWNLAKGGRCDSGKKRTCSPGQRC